jgi:hypothetical protein
MVTKNNTGSTYTYPNAPSVVQPSDVLNLHPGPNNERSIVRWSSPSSGTYAVSGRFEGIDTGGTTTDVLITKNGTTLFTGVLNGYGNQLPFSLPVTVTAGDILEFSVGYGANGSYNSDSTGLAVTITGGGAGGGSSETVHWLVTDHLGTPRMSSTKAALWQPSSATIIFHSAKSCSQAPAAAQQQTGTAVLQISKIAQGTKSASSSPRKNEMWKQGWITSARGITRARRGALALLILY